MRKNSKKISVILIITLLVTMLAPVSYAEAAAEPYLAYQTTEDGAAVNKLPSAAEKEMYRVEKLLMSPGEKVDLCFINAGKWKNSKWTSSDTNVATVNGKGLITAKNSGVAEITLTYQKKLTNKKVTVKTKVYVGEKAWDVGIGTNSQMTVIDRYQMKVGNDIDLNVYGIPEINSWNYQIQWTSSNQKVVEMLGNTLYARKAGKADVTVKIKNGATGKVIEKKVSVEVTNPANTELENWDNEYYRLYGENYKRMFSTDALSAAASEIELDMLDEADNVLQKKMKAIGISGLLELTDVANAAGIASTIFKGKDYLKEEGRRETLLYLIQEISDDSISEKYVGNVKDSLEKAKGIFGELGNVNDFEGAVKELDSAGLNLKATEVNAIVKYFRNDAAGDMKKILSEGVTITEYMVTTLCLYEADAKLLDDLQKCSDPGEALYDDIELLKKEREKNPVQYFKERYIGDVAGRVIGKACLKLIGKEVTGILDAVDGVLSMGADMAGVASLDDAKQAAYLMEYALVLRGKIVNLRVDMKNNFDTYSNEELKEQIEKYELMYNTYLSMIDPVCSSVYKLEKSWNQELLDDALIPTNGYDYKRHVAEAMNIYLNAYPSSNEQMPVKDINTSGKESTITEKIQVKMDDLLNKLGVKSGKTTYFTVNQKACASSRYSSHGCTNCNVGTIINASWFKNKFGTVNTSLFPSHDVNASRRDHAGQSCFGFACFAQWYVYANSNTDKVTAERVATIKFNKADLQANVQPGDVLRVNGHSLLVYAVEDKGLRVIDSNWNMGSQLNCVVQKHLITYDIAWCAGKTTYVNRVTDVQVTNTGAVVNDTAKGQVGYLDLSKVGWSAYNVGTDVEMGTDKAYTIYPGSKLKILGTYINSKGNKIYHVYSESLKMNCYVSAKYVSVGVAPVATQAPKPTATPKPTVTPKPTAIPTPKATATPKPTVTPKPTATPKPNVSPQPTVTPVPEKTYGYLDLSALGWSAYNVGTDVEMNASKAYTIYPGSKLEIIGKYINSKGNQIYHVYSESLGMKCYVAAKVVTLGEAPKKVYGTLNLKSVGWKAYNAGTDVELNADRAYTIYDGAQLEILGTYTNSKGNKIYHVYSSDLKMKCYVAARFVQVKK